MQVYGQVDYRMPLREIESFSQRVEALGYDGLVVPDSVHDGFLACYAALRQTSRLKIASSVIVAFPRSPMITAVAAWDLQSSSGGRYELGLGTQVRGNVVGRYSTAWTPPVPRMKEYIESLRAIWHAFQSGGALDYRGEHYRFTRLQPFFSPGPIEHPEVPIFVGAVGPRMTELIGEIADGLMTHSTNSDPEYLRRMTRPSLARGAERAGRRAASIELLASPFIATGATSAEVDSERERIRDLLGFLFSTPGYGRPLAMRGWEELGDRLHALSRAGKWTELGRQIPDELLTTLVPCGTYDEIVPILSGWYRGVSSMLFFPVPTDPQQDRRVATVVEALKTAR